MKSIKKVSLHEMIAEEIKKYINEHQFKRGNKLPSVGELTTILSGSRSSIREALRYLEGIDVLEVQNGKGIFVKDGDALKIEANILFNIHHLICFLFQDIAVSGNLSHMPIFLNRLCFREVVFHQLDKGLRNTVTYKGVIQFSRFIFTFSYLLIFSF
ncbi:FadR/GntR family transcriptional regulator [Neobacillus ginsengisoli]|uniref:DNA-binding transcriptional regulator YhcF (GntR family) n=1 Tax=Neobacillus ginsengisoli TaxID=904295 RepID=A0ABT9XXF7_9BACI|nr:GntR family transcriptional regulator [Neobacillus ginsengisoli]MDQ0200256.1 DNA-binding transcriptional regulator YhcF (GntR family) [Neobacillus ginsengisoli]